MSKLLPIPTFKALPMRTDAADVKENIDLWLSKPEYYAEQISQLLIKSDSVGSYKGYRFISPEDLTDVVHKEVFFKFSKPLTKRGIHLEVIFIRRYHRIDTFNPFWFGVQNTTIIAKNKYGSEMCLYESDAQLKRFIQSFNK